MQQSTLSSPNLATCTSVAALKNEAWLDPDWDDKTVLYATCVNWNILGELKFHTLSLCKSVNVWQNLLKWVAKFIEMSGIFFKDQLQIFKMCDNNEWMSDKPTLYCSGQKWVIIFFKNTPKANMWQWHVCQLAINIIKVPLGADW